MAIKQKSSSSSISLLPRARAPRSGFGARLELALWQRRWTQAQLAAEIGCTRAAISQWITGVTAPTAGHLVAAARVLSLSANWLTDGTRDSGEATAELLVAIWRRLSLEDRAAAIAQIGVSEVWDDGLAPNL
jgi:transcriptional regulator with XRE-family HTH domain